MSLTIDSGLGRSLCKFGNREITLVSNQEEIEKNDLKEHTEFHLDPKKNIKFRPTPDKNTERQILYITGASGSGKSTYCVNYLNEYKKSFPKNNIYVLSALSEDETLDKVKDLKRIKINDRLVSDPIDPKLFNNCCVVADDIDVIGNKAQREAVYIIVNAILETGRHFHCSLVMTNHLPTGGNDTRRVLNEAHAITFFPHSGSVHGIKYLLEKYVGMSKEDFKKAKASKSRWCTFWKHYPAVIMGEYDIWLPQSKD